ncbi:hypothetical protein LK996_01160 [Lysobacter sp. A6]|uniref:Uncharacterized protein n=1 Tax=Noviluteimonas lactosilytica TaxID=2888523 RepID=A0ABS8JDY2_9GAMM|nr:hypothetical protein [Lysobacter lactosilyticus]MCC8361693.1 hypothetical protein [Lysobacter lactosilyticus]
MHRTRFLASLACCLALVAGSANAQLADTAHKRITYTRWVEAPEGGISNFDLYRIDSDARNRRLLMPSIVGFYRWQPQWSPSGTYVVFSQVRDSNFDTAVIRIVDLFGQNARQLTTGTGLFDWPSWSPDGKWIAYRSLTLAGSCITIVRPNGSDRRNVTCVSGVREMQARAAEWSSDSKRLYTAIGSNPLPEGFRFLQPVRIDVASGARTPLAPAMQVDGNQYSLIFSPDRKKGIVQNLGGVGGGALIWDFPSNTTGAFIDGYSAVWSPDGKSIAFARPVVSGLGTERDTHLPFTMNVDGTNVRPLLTTILTGLYYAPVDWSADGKRVLCNRQRYEQRSPGVFVPTLEMRVIEVETRAITNLGFGRADWGAWHRRH